MIYSHHDLGRHPSGSSHPNQVIPMLRWGVRVRDDGTAGLIELNDTEYCFKGILSETFSRVMCLLDGRRTLSAIANDAGVQLDLVLILFDKLLSLDLVVDLNTASKEDISPSVFLSICKLMFPIWKERLFSHSLWRLLSDGEATQSQFIGWVIENYHFIEGVNDRLALAIAECTDQKLRLIFAQHYVEEWDHAHFFMKTLNRLGLDAESVLSSRPLPSTLAVLNHMRHCAKRDPLEYAVCSGFLESTGTDRTRGLTFFDELTKHYGNGCIDVLRPLADHVRLDESYEHDLSFQKICGQLEQLPRERASNALAAGAMLVETLEMWSTDILKSYIEPDSFPRISLHHYRTSPVRSLAKIT